MSSVRVNFQNGDTVGDVRCIPISILDDTKVENDEHFDFTLTNGRGTQFNETSVQIFILEDDGMFACMSIKLLQPHPQDTPSIQYYIKKSNQ